MSTVLLTPEALLAEIGIDLADHIGVYDGHETILVPNESIAYERGQFTEVPSAIELLTGKVQSFPTRTRYELSLTSASLRVTNTKDRQGRLDFNAVAIGKRDLDVHIGGHWVSVGEFISLLIKAANPQEQRSTEQILASFRQRGLAIGESMPVFFQHLGADRAKFYDEVVPFLRSQGAVDNTDTVNRNARASRPGADAQAGSALTEMSYRFENSGLPISKFVAGTADRSKSATHSGYLSPLDATYTTVMSIVQADRLIAACDTILADDNASAQDKALADTRRSTVMTYWMSGQQRDRRPFHNWGGTTQGMNASIPGALSFWSTSVPCAELVVVGADGSEHEINMWRRNSAAVANEEVLPSFGDINLGDAPIINPNVADAEGDTTTPY